MQEEGGEEGEEGEEGGEGVRAGTNREQRTALGLITKYASLSRG